jgi:hypothetical protein
MRFTDSIREGIQACLYFREHTTRDRPVLDQFGYLTLLQG